MLWTPANFLAARVSVLRGLVAPDFARELADLEPIHLELEGTEGNPERACGRGHVPARLFERADEEVALESGHRPLEQVLRRRRVRIQLSHVELVGQVFVSNPVLVRYGDDAFDQVLELADVAGPPVRAEDAQGRVCYSLHVLA